MAKIHNDVFDYGIITLTEDADQLWVLDVADVDPDPADYAAALAARVGRKIGVTVGAPQDGAVSGRRVITGVFNDGEALVTTNNAARWALVDTATLRLLTVRKLSAALSIVAGSSLSLNALSVTITDPAAD